MATLEQLVASLSPDDNLRGHEFEPVAKWFLENDPVQKAQYKRVWQWNDWPGAWAADAGIDLVAERRNGDLVAVQVKCYRTDRLVSKRDMDTFLSESSRATFAERLLVATCDLGRTARRTVEGQEKPVHTLLLADLEQSSVDWPTTPITLRPFFPKRHRPRPHQRDAINDVRAGLEATNRGQLIMACGTGKTLTSLWVAEALNAQRTLVLVPSLSLLSQTVREWKDNDARDFDFIAVCSDQTVIERDAIIAYTADLPFTGVTSDPSEIAAFLRRRGPRVIFATYQSSPKIAEAQRSARAPRFDLAIADEAHRCAGKPDAAFAAILDGRAIRATKRLFMTATPRIASAQLRRAAEEFDLDIASMDDEGAFGPVFHRLSFGKSIQRELLSDYRVAIIVVDDETVREYAEHGTLVELNGEVRDARSLAAQIGLAKAMRRFNLRRTLTFHSRVNAAAMFARSLPDVVDWMPRGQRPGGSLWTAHVSGSMPSGQRNRVLRRLAQVGVRERAVVSNARCLGEGVDVPTLDGVAFIDPRRSQVDVVQAVGRAIRKAADKSVGTIVLPMFISSEEALRPGGLDASVFEPIVQVLRALRDHDEQLGEELDALRRELGRRGSIRRLPGKIRIDAPASIGMEFVRSLEAKVVELTSRSWEVGFGWLQAFVDREGHSRIPFSYRDDSGHWVGGWVGTQRRHYRSGNLPQERASRLESLPGWTWEPYDGDWETGFAALTKFARREGVARVPQGHRENGFRLGNWVNAQLKRRREGVLSADRASRLESVPGWVWNQRDYGWEVGFAALQAFVEREGHALVPGHYSEDGFNVGLWVSNQRHRRTNLTRDQVDRLEALPGWTWQPNTDRWERGYLALREFVEIEGHARVPQSHVTADGYALGVWVNSQRGFHRRGSLPAERVERLEALPGWVWLPYDDLWESSFARLERFVMREGHSRVPHLYRDNDGFRLGGWVDVQKQAHREGDLSEDRCRRLESLPGWVWRQRERSSNQS